MIFADMLNSDLTPPPKMEWIVCCHGFSEYFDHEDDARHYMSKADPYGERERLLVRLVGEWVEVP